MLQCGFARHNFICLVKTGVISKGQEAHQARCWPVCSCIYFVFLILFFFFYLIVAYFFPAIIMQHVCTGRLGFQLLLVFFLLIFCLSPVSVAMFGNSNRQNFCLFVISYFNWKKSFLLFPVAVSLLCECPPHLHCFYLWLILCFMCLWHLF